MLWKKRRQLQRCHGNARTRVTHVWHLKLHTPFVTHRAHDFQHRSPSGVIKTMFKCRVFFLFHRELHQLLSEHTAEHEKCCSLSPRHNCPSDSSHSDLCSRRSFSKTNGKRKKKQHPFHVSKHGCRLASVASTVQGIRSCWKCRNDKKWFHRKHQCLHATPCV